MKRKEITIYELEKKIRKGEKIIFFGAGLTLVDTLNRFPELVYSTEFIVDNSVEKIGTNFKTGMGTEVPIFCPDHIKEIDYKKYIFIFTLNAYEEAYAQLESMIGCRIEYYVSPIIDLQCGSWHWKLIEMIREICNHLPLRKAILFCGWGDSQRENELTLLQYLKANGYEKEYKIVWQCDNEMTGKYGVKEITRDVLKKKRSIKEIWEYYYYHMTSKYIFWENHNVKWSRKNQILVYLNHGTPPIKETKRTIVITPNVTYACCPSENVKNIVSEQYSIDPDKLIISGSPRFDHLFDENNVISEFIPKKFSKYILWVPTFRQHNILKGRIDSKSTYPLGIPIIKDLDDFKLINDKLREMDMALLIKPHPLQDMTFLKINEASNIFLLEQQVFDEKMIGINQLLKSMDAMITDYSTIAFDYMLLDRMIGYTIDDMDDYSIGFSVDNPLDFMPGMHISSLDEFISFLNDVYYDNDIFKEKRNSLKNRIHKYQTNGNSRRLLDLLKL